MCMIGNVSVMGFASVICSCTWGAGVFASSMRAAAQQQSNASQELGLH